MDHAITIRDLLIWILAFGGVFALGAILVGIIYLLNPFRTGH